MTIEYVPAGVARLAGVGGGGVGLLFGVLLVEDELPPHASSDARITTSTISASSLSFLPLPFLRMSLNSTMPGRSNHNAYILGCANGEGAREAVTLVVLTVTFMVTPDEVANAVCGEKEQVAPMGKLAHKNEKVWFTATLAGVKAR